MLGKDKISTAVWATLFALCFALPAFADPEMGTEENAVIAKTKPEETAVVPEATPEETSETAEVKTETTEATDVKTEETTGVAEIKTEETAKAPESKTEEPAKAPESKTEEPAVAAQVPVEENQDLVEEMIENNIPYLSDGIGTEERHAMEAKAKNYNLLLTSANKMNQYVANTNFVIVGKDGKQMIAVANAGPLFFVKLPPGAYTVKATAGTQKNDERIVISPDKTAFEAFVWKVE
jgi:hypothetical protein